MKLFFPMRCLKARKARAAFGAFSRAAGLLGVLFVGTAARAEYPSPAEAGFRNCMLIYYTPRRDPADFRYLVACADRTGKPRRWGWDAFLFLRQPAPGGGNFEQGTATAADWRAALEDWFAPTGDVRRLADAVAATRARLGPPPTPRQAIFSLHYLRRDAPFAVGAEGENAALPPDAGRAAVVERYLEKLLRRWRALAPESLDLWGFYWMSETLPETDHDFLRTVAGAVHRRGYRLLWIPCSTAQGVEAARGLGVDVVLLQPNYAFLSQHQGGVRWDRLPATARRARRLGLGVEIECDYDLDTNPWSRAIFLDYLALGAPRFCGYGQAPRAYFQSFDVFPRCARASDPAVRAVYDAVCGYLGDVYPPRPGSLSGARCRINGSSDGAALTDDRLAGCPEEAVPTVTLSGERAVVAVDLPAPRRVGQVELGVTAATPGLRVATIRGRLRGRVLPRIGWRRETLFGAGRHTFWLPWGETCDHFEVTVTQFPPGRLTLDELTVAPAPAEAPAERHLARGCAYTLAPAQPRQYPDPGGRLTDGARATRGWEEGKSVGYDGRHVEVAFDWDSPRAIERVVVYCDDDPASGVHAPQGVAAEFYPRARGRFFPDHGRQTGCGETAAETGLPDLALPAAVVMGGAWEKTGASATRPESVSERLELRVEPPVAGRELRLVFRGGAWLMLSEIEAWAGGRNLLRGAAYRVAPLPRARVSVRYPDDGRKLTDGVVARTLVRREVVGWNDGPPRTVTVSLGRVTRVREAAVHALGGGRYGARWPRRVTFQGSLDGQGWKPLGETAPENPPEGAPPRLESRRLAVTTSPVEARFIRARIEPAPGWCVISEIEVR
jgi:hypothetical protein